MGYRLSWNGRSAAFFPDNELRPPGAASCTERPLTEFAREQRDKLVDFLRGTDLLVMDSQYDNQEYHQHVGWGHGCVDHVVELALEAGVRQLFLFHHDPDHSDEKIEQMVQAARELVAASHGAMTVEAAREGLVVEVAAAGAKRP